MNYGDFDKKLLFKTGLVIKYLGNCKIWSFHLKQAIHVPFDNKQYASYC